VKSTDSGEKEISRRCSLSADCEISSGGAGYVSVSDGHANHSEGGNRNHDREGRQRTMADAP
jgi:hypothetical protein